MLPTINYKKPVQLFNLFDEFEGFFANELSQKPSTSFRPNVDIHEDQDYVYLAADLPGVLKKDIQLKIEEGVLTLSGSKETKQDDSKSHFYRFERQGGSFERQFNLSDKVDPNQIEADFKEGVLTVRLAKKEEAKPKVIDVKIK